jgi:hypothetical protein
MNKMRHLSLILVFLTVIIFSPDAASAQELMPLDEVEAGMRGTGRSVFRGDRLEEFQVEILGILHNAIGPKQSLILAKLTGEQVDQAGVIAGMSGSPVFIDGKLVGAVAYRIGSFTHEAIAGITPIHDMLKLQELPRRADTGADPELLDGLLARIAPPADSGPIASGDPDPDVRPTAAGSGIEPIRTPLVFSGFSSEVLESFSGWFEARGFQPVLGGGGAGSEGAGGGEALVYGGSPIAGQLVRGDMGIAATGTVTWRDGDRVLAFGHPFLRLGAVEVPMATASVIHTLSSSLGSFKISVPGEIVGQFTQDRLTAIYGEIGTMPDMVPVELVLDNGRDAQTYGFEIFQNPVWTPGLLFMTLANGMVGTIDFSSEATIQATVRYRLEGYPDLEVQNVYSSLGSGLPLPFAASLDIAKMFNILYSNLFEAPTVSEVSVRMDQVEEARFALVTGLRAPRLEVEPGDEVPVEILLTPYRGEPIRKVVTLKVPEDTPPGPLVLLAGSHNSVSAAEGGLLNWRIANASNLNQLIRILAEERRNDHLYVKMFRRVSGAVVQSEILTDLPPSVISILNSKQVSQSKTKLSVAPVESISVATDWILVGARRIDFKVK